MDFEIRKDRRQQGAQALVREREEYFRLMDQGVSSREACRIVGIDRRTGKRWRNGFTRSDSRKWTPPVNLTSVPGPLRHLREADRIHIADRLREKASIRAIAAELGRSPSTISREVHRNRTVLAVELPASRGTAPRRQAPSPAQATQDRADPEAVGLRPRPPRQALEPGTDLPGSSHTLPRPSGDARGPRDDLPGPLRPGPRRTAPGTGRRPANRPHPTQTPPPGPAAPEPNHRTPPGPKTHRRP